MRITNDELVLALISLVRATHPRMLVPEADGVSVDFEALSRLKRLGPDERLLFKLRAVLEPTAPVPSPIETSAPETAAAPVPAAPESQSNLTEQPDPQAHALSIDLTPVEARRIAGTLANLERLQQWPADVLDMSRGLRARLNTL